MGVNSRRNDARSAPRAGVPRGNSLSATPPDRTSYPAGTAYSLQGEEDLFRDPFADFTPSGR